VFIYSREIQTVNAGTYQIYYKNQNIIPRCIYQKKFWFKFLGLIGRESLLPEDAIFLNPCNGIHTCFMNFNIDVVFIDADYKILRCFPRLEPWQFVVWVKNAYGALEMCTGMIERFGLKENEKLLFVPEGELPPDPDKEETTFETEMALMKSKMQLSVANKGLK
jgi:uncharacterized membrane protein (UPF0127 family)